MSHEPTPANPVTLVSPHDAPLAPVLIAAARAVVRTVYAHQEADIPLTNEATDAAAETLFAALRAAGALAPDAEAWIDDRELEETDLGPDVVVTTEDGLLRVHPTGAVSKLHTF